MVRGRGKLRGGELLPGRTRSSFRFQPPYSAVADELRLYFNDELRRYSKLAVFSHSGASHEMQQAVVCRRLPPLRSASVVGYWNTQCARRRSCLSQLRGRSDSKTAMHKHLSCTLSRLSSSEPVAKVRVSGCLPGLHPIHLYWFRTWMTDVPFGANGGGQACHT